jgi:site-specific DNA-methyltransferase (adenine-specific)
VPDNVWCLIPRDEPRLFQPESDSWLESRVCGTFKAKVDHDNQIPIPIMERIIRVASNPGDLVLDPFAGTGTTCVAAANLGRNYLGIELGETTAAVAHRRIAERKTAVVS